MIDTIALWVGRVFCFAGLFAGVVFAAVFLVYWPIEHAYAQAKQYLTARVAIERLMKIIKRIKRRKRKR